MTKNSKRQIKRRDFLKTATLMVGSTFGLPRVSIAQAGPSANSKLNIAMIGAGGIAKMAYGSCGDDNLVALCDVDEKKFGQCAKEFPAIHQARRFADFRVMLDKMGNDIDAVCINTPDHTHFVATMECMQRGKHVITQKPLTHDIWQARTLRRAARKYQVVTNMANQGHTYDGIRKMKEWVEAGLLGQVTEVHSGFDGPNWKGRYFRKPDQLPPSAEPVPAGLDWDLWKGPVEEPHYSSCYHPLTWRGFWKFGGGELGDWFCHIGDGPVWVLDLYEPTVIECVERQVNGQGDVLCPDSSVIRWDFPARGKLAPCSLYWSDGQCNGGSPIQTPSDWSWSDGEDASGKTVLRPPKKMGSYWTGSKANAFLDERSNKPLLTDMAKHEELMESDRQPPVKYRRVKGGPHQEWMDAIKGRIPECGSNFEYAARLTEIDLLGVLAQRFGGRIEWDAASMKITNRPELNAYLKEPVRKGWEYGDDLWKA
jgi:predicted dehydrogenase